VKGAKQRSATQSFVDYVITQFLEAGGILQATITAGRTLLHESVLKGSGGSTVVRRALLAATAETANTQQQQQCCLLAQQDCSGCTALHAAVEASTASWHNTKALRDLLSRSSAAALIEALPKQDKDGRSVLHYAVSKSSDADGSLQKLLSKCNELGVLSSVLRIRDYSGADAVGHARRYGRAAVLSLLQQHGIHEVRLTLSDTLLLAMHTHACTE
jgi:ankyrin repeat protein